MEALWKLYGSSEVAASAGSEPANKQQEKYEAPKIEEWQCKDRMSRGSEGLSTRLHAGAGGLYA